MSFTRKQLYLSFLIGALFVTQFVYFNQVVYINGVDDALIYAEYETKELIEEAEQLAFTAGVNQGVAASKNWLIVVCEKNVPFKLTEESETVYCISENKLKGMEDAIRRSAQQNQFSSKL